MSYLNTVHRLLAVPILIFVIFHLFNHIVSIAGIDSHLKYMNAFRLIYRNPIVEIILFLSLFCQMGIGLYFVFRSRNKRAGFFQRARAVLNGRFNLGLDTNFYFASAGMHIGQLKLFFIPYYFLGVFAVFTHIACFINRRMSRNSSIVLANRISAIVMISGMLCGVLIVASLAGVFYDISIPEEYAQMF